VRNLMRALLSVKFLPVPTLFVPLWAGVRGMPAWPFFLLDTLINLLWASSFLVIGYTIEREISTVPEDSAWIFCAALVVVFHVPLSRNYWKLRQSQGSSATVRQCQ